MADLTGMMQAAAGAGEENLYIEDVFSTYLYTGNGSTQTITNSIDLAGEGGLVWQKCRTQALNNRVTDTVRGATKTLITDSTTDEQTYVNGLTSFNSNGFSIGTDGPGNNLGDTFVSWTFREQPKFFDVVTYTGDGVAGRTVAHNLGSVPGCIMVKRRDASGAWQVYHRANTANPETDYLVLNTTAATADSNTRWNDTQPTDAVFSLGTEATVNASGGTYVAYLFAHNAGGFGLTGTDNVISCGSYSHTNGSNTSVTLGFEPQFCINKFTGVGIWKVMDSARGMPALGGGNGRQLQAQSSDAEESDSSIKPTATGFIVDSSLETGTFIYIAIRRGPMKVPTTGTSVFVPIARSGTGADATVTTNTVVDTVISHQRNSAGTDPATWDRLRGINIRLRTSGNFAEASSANSVTGFDINTGYKLGADGGNAEINYSGLTYANWLFSRAPGFFDVVCYTGTGSATTFSHNLTVVPELMIVKRRDLSGAWDSYCSALANTEYVVLNTTAAKATGATRWNSTTPTSSVFSVGTSTTTNASAGTFVAYLFASAPRVSKVGSYTGTAAAQTINCGFTAGARFVLIKRTDDTGDWYVWDSVRGIVAGDDPYLLLNSTDAEVTNTDYVDTAATGFELTSTAPAAINASGGTYIFLAIA